MRHHCFWLLLLTLFCSSSLATTIQLDRHTVKLGLAGKAELLEDINGELDLEQIIAMHQQGLFQPFTVAQSNRGVTRSHYWLAFTLVNESDEPLTWVLTPETSYLDDLTLYTRSQQDDWQRHVRSDHDVFNQRDQQYRLLNVRYSQAPQSTVQAYLKLSNRTLETVSIQGYVSEQGAFTDHLIEENLLFGIYYGLFFGMTLFAFALWRYSGVRKSPYFGYFFVYLSLSMLMWASLNGFSFQFLWPQHPWLFNQSFHIIYLGVAIFSFQFSRYLLNTPTLLPKIDKALLGLIAIYLLAIPLRLLGFYDLVLYISFFSLLSMTIQPLLGWMCYQRGNQYVVFYIIAWIPYSISLFASLISATSEWSTFGMSTLNMSQLAVLFECFMLVLAMLAKMKHSSHKLQAEAELSMIDSLTQLKNRRYIEQCSAQLAEQVESGVEYWLLLIDLDDFKQINDKHGHVVGDQVLQELATILKNECRSVDVAARWGGEEFVIITNVINQRMALIIAERIRRTFAKQVSQANGNQVPHTLSIGLAKWDAAGNQTFSHCFEQADQALYHAKQNGRNQVVSYHAELANEQIVTPVQK
ncbi:sensor domain-containing diguanylate cyclase [Neiella marina]|uniref:diguanylate cyclase n=1 Tax=Neiella holothuriorum TaxID=2870530 RepID=A0ABS7EJK1_9GAMM|nr:diguanylate cyclase [Neiella holothuriorum]MBW8192514.1 sensor domain-containing diguanylate cyclase [Neiella holothuriorum]